MWTTLYEQTTIPTKLRSELVNVFFLALGLPGCPRQKAIKLDVVVLWYLFVYLCMCGFLVLRLDSFVQSKPLAGKNVS